MMEKQVTYQNWEDTRYRQRFPILYMSEYSQTKIMLGSVSAILQPEFFKRIFSHDGAYALLST